MLNSIAKLVFVLLFLLPGGFSFSQTPNAVELFNLMRASIDQTHTSSFNIKTLERHKGKYTTSEYLAKVQAHPYKVYVYSIAPNPGAKAIYAEGENHNKAIVRPNSFPYFNMSFSPYHSLLRKNHHFTMKEMGFGYIKDLFDQYVKRDSVMFMNTLLLLSETEFDKKKCYRLCINPPDFKLIDYVVQKGENITAISKKSLLNDNMILENNPRLSGMNDVKAGDVIKVPNVFAKRIILYLDKQNYLPIVQEMYDDKGLFIRVEITGLVRNPKFDDGVFSKDGL